MARLPQVGGDDGTWGQLLNDFLSVEHNADGSLKLRTDPALTGKASDAAVVHNSGDETVAGVKTFSSSPLVPTPTNGTDATNKTYVDNAAASGTPDATSSTKGKIQLAGDLVGTAASPTVIDASTYRFHKTATAEILASDPVYGTPGTRAAFINALNAAEVLGKGTIVRIPAGLTVDVGNGLSLSGYSCQILGAGAGIYNPGPVPGISVIKASTQSGPVLDFTGYTFAANFRGRTQPLANVHIQGSGAADATLANCGLKIDLMESAWFHDIAIMSTGGPCVEMTAQTPGSAVYLCDFDRIFLYTPVSAKTNDVPYFRGTEANGNRFRGWGLRATAGSADCGPSGAVVFRSSSSFPAHDNLFDAWWYENLHAPTNGTLFALAADANIIRDFQFFDCYKESGATGTSYFRLTPPATGDYGGNIIQGVIPGKDPGVATAIDTGVDLQQSRNRIVGVKGYRGTNVTLASGVDRTYLHLGGSYSGASDPGYVDNSGSSNNHLIDDYLATEVAPAAWSVNGITQRTGTGSPESAVVGAIGDRYVRTDGTPSAVLYIKSKFAGLNTGWMPAMCENLGSGNVSVNQSIPLQTNTAWKFTLLASISFTSVTNARTGAVMTLMLAQPATGGPFTVTSWPSNMKWAGGTAPTLSTAANAVDVFCFMYDGTNWRELSRAVGT